MPRTKAKARARFSRRRCARQADPAGDLLCADCGYPDAPATTFLEKVKSGEEPPVALPAFVAAKVE